MPYFDLVCRQCGHVVEDHHTFMNDPIHVLCCKCKAEGIVILMVKLPSRIQTTYNQKGKLNK